jgi:hypothetical protein
LRVNPVANLRAQLEAADAIMQLVDDAHSADYHSEELELARELAELVQALDQWRSRGGFDPYMPGANEPPSPSARFG